MADNFTLQLTSCTELNDNTVHFEFKILDEQSLELIAGQFIRLLFEQDGQEVFRSYSVANILKSNTGTIDTIELAVSWVKGGLATVGLSAMKIGEVIKASAPYGRFCLTEDKFKRYFLVATGTGVTPYRAMANELKSRIKKDNAEVFIVMGARDEPGLLYANEFRENAKELENYYYVSCLSRDKLEHPSKLDFEGHVQTYLKTIKFNAENDVAYLCGNPAMVDEAFALLKEAGMPVPQIRREKYVSPPVRKKKAAFIIRA
ncbi:MAG: FAD-binding oxidoreductase [Proteobacteria bacterium]|nr:FAD-binding oxidoreductase [Pseudomonadota bacterium]